MKEIDHYFDKQEEPVKSTLLALKSIILAQDKDLILNWKYGMPFIYYKNKMFCYLWQHKKYKQPYIGLVDGQHFNEPYLLQEKRARMKIMLIDPSKDIPKALIVDIIQKALQLHK